MIKLAKQFPALLLIWHPNIFHYLNLDQDHCHNIRIKSFVIKSSHSRVVILQVDPAITLGLRV
jgi:hypothetical protein